MLDWEWSKDNINREYKNLFGVRVRGGGGGGGGGGALFDHSARA